MAKARKGRRQREMDKAAWALLKRGQRECIAANLQEQSLAPRRTIVAPVCLKGAPDSIIVCQQRKARFTGVNWSQDPHLSREVDVWRSNIKG